MLEYNAFTCYTWAGSGIRAGDCIVLCAVRNAGIQCIHLLHWGRLRYSRRWLHCSLCSQECWSTIIHSPATLGQALVFAQVIALFSVQLANAGIQCIHLLHWGRLRYSRRWLHCSLCSQECWNTIYSPATLGQAPAPVFAQVIALFSVQSGMLEYNTFTCYTWAGSGIRAGDCIVLCAVRNVGVQCIHLLHLGRLRYSRRWLHCSLCSQECWNTMHSPATLGQAPVFAQVIALFSVQSGMLEYNLHSPATLGQAPVFAQVIALFPKPLLRLAPTK